MTAATSAAVQGREDAEIDYGDGFRLGIVVPSGNVIAEPEIAAMLPVGVQAYITRLPLKGSSDSELVGMLDSLDQATDLLGDAQPDLLAFHCTAVTTYDDALGAEIRERMTDRTGIPTIVTSEAIVDALRALGARRVVLLTPYIAGPHRREIRFLEEHGFTVVSDASLGIDTNAEMAQLPPAELRAFAERNRHSDADAYLISCTALRSAGIIAPLELSLGAPVITSNQAMVWNALKSLGAGMPVPGFGSVFER